MRLRWSAWEVSWRAPDRRWPPFPGANGKIAFTSNRPVAGQPPNANVWTMRPDGRNPVNLTPNSAANDSWPNWRADGRKIAFRSNRDTPGNSVPEGFERPDFVMNADGSHVRQITFNELLKPSRDLGARDLLVLARPPLETRLCQGAPGNNLVSSLVAIPVLGLPRSY